MASSVESSSRSSSDVQGPPGEEGDSADAIAAVPRQSLPRVLDYDTLRCLPQPRAEVVGTRNKFMEPILPNSNPPPSSDENLFRLEPISKPKPDETLLRRFEPPQNPSFRLGSSLLRTRLKNQEFPPGTLNFVTRNCLTHGWKQWVEDFFDRGGKPLRILERVGIKDAVWISSRLQTRRHSEDLEFLVQRWSNLTHTFVTAWGEFTPTLEDVYVLLKLPCFGTADILLGEVPAAVARIADRLKSAATDSAYYTNRLTKKRSTRSNKQTYASWVRYFFGVVKFRNKDTKEEGWVVEADLHYDKDLELPALIAFWLDRYVFPGPSSESVSPGVFVFAAMLALGMRLPLAPMYLGGLYGRLDQVQEQFKISNGRYGVNNYADINFLALFLFERFKYYAPPRTLPREFTEGDTTYEAPRAWAWLGSKEIGDKAQCSLANVIDKEAYFCFRPYIVDSSVDSRQAGFERRSRIYGFCSAERSDRANLYEDVHDFWRLCCHVGTLVGYVVTDCLGGPGGATFPSLYRPDRVVRQLGWDQMPTTTDMGVITVREAYIEFLLLDPGKGDLARTSLIPRTEYEPGVSAAWLAYHASLIRSLRNGEQNRKKIPSIVGVGTPLSIVYNDPYYSVSTSAKGKRSAQEVPRGDSKRIQIKFTVRDSSTTPAKRVAANILDEASRGQAASVPSSIRAPSTQTRVDPGLKIVRQVSLPSTSSASDKGAQGSSHPSPSFEDASRDVDTSVSPQMIHPSNTSVPTKPTPRMSVACLSRLLVQARGDSQQAHDGIASMGGLEHLASFAAKEHQEGEFHRDMGVHDEERLEARPYDEITANKEKCRKRSSADGEAHRGGEEHIVPSTGDVDSVELPCEGGVTHVEEHPQGDTISPLVHPDVEKELSSLSLPTNSIAVLGPFLTAHPAMRLTTRRVFRCMAYECLSQFLLFAGTHSLSALLSDKQGDYIDFMEALARFPFDSTWLDDIRARVTAPSLASSQRALEQVLSNKQRVSVKITRLESEMKVLKSEMESLEVQEARIRSLLDAPLLKL